MALWHSREIRLASISCVTPVAELVRSMHSSRVLLIVSGGFPHDCPKASRLASFLSFLFLAHPRTDMQPAWRQACSLACKMPSRTPAYAHAILRDSSRGLSCYQACCACCSCIESAAHCRSNIVDCQLVALKAYMCRAEEDNGNAVKRVEQFQSIGLEAQVRELLQDRYLEVRERAITAMNSFKYGRQG